ncbi:MAG: NUDIX hydrolase [Lachnospiraceae bacterium]|nr:NUDIX hydrolase [Lachnospiraceae bacterium]
MKVERLKRTQIAKGTILTYYHDTVRIPNGHVCEFDFLGHQGAAAVLPVTEDGKLLLVRQYRNALDRFTLEIPAGGLEGPGEPTREAAARELTEETGFVAGRIDFLLSVVSAVAYCNEKIDIYLARDLQKSERHLDADEYINVEAWEGEELLELAYNGTLQDAKTVAAVMAYQNGLAAGRWG